MREEGVEAFPEVTLYCAGTFPQPTDTSTLLGPATITALVVPVDLAASTHQPFKLKL
ncbi:unnamed protein product [Fusarium graminearum]|uniref:Chromosome 3, complete genome n=1 Tax=Gibberella zeae (strain ATCC MYA-4620 / CBS 123657 / FGSC 9075 / NRRL 31084 / PH-1) TaxID=229533 RepID=A0A098E331_GIBZE|nr:unnamed protein product [Fusarium graminearum]CZS84290.1 unnamed protein product [Fusarium graminearum]